MNNEGSTMVAVVYHSAAHYREPVFSELFSRNFSPEFVLFCGTTSNHEGINLVNPSIARQPVEQGGWRWRIIRNFWFGEILFQPRILLLPFQRKWRCVIFLGNAYYSSTWISAAICRLFGKRVLMWTHGFRAEPVGFSGRLKLVFFKLAHGLILYGNNAKRILVRCGFRSETLYVAYNSLDHSGQCRLRKPWGSITRMTCDEDHVLVWVGRFTVRKAIPVLLKALAILLDQKVNVRLVLVGDGPELEEMQRLSGQLGIQDHIEFRGAIYEETQLAEIMQEADLAISPGPIGLFAIHAQTYGLPVITSDDWAGHGPEVESIIEGITGNFFSAGDPVSLATVIRQWLFEPRNHEETHLLCQKNIDSRYTPRHQARIINDAVLGLPPHDSACNNSACG